MRTVPTPLRVEKIFRGIEDRSRYRAERLSELAKRAREHLQGIETDDADLRTGKLAELHSSNRVLRSTTDQEIETAWQQAEQSYWSTNVSERKRSKQLKTAFSESSQAEIHRHENAVAEIEKAYKADCQRAKKKRNKDAKGFAESTAAANQIHDKAVAHLTANGLRIPQNMLELSDVHSGLDKNPLEGIRERIDSRLAEMEEVQSLLQQSKMVRLANRHIMLLCSLGVAGVGLAVGFATMGANLIGLASVALASLIAVLLLFLVWIRPRAKAVANAHVPNLVKLSKEIGELENHAEQYTKTVLEFELEAASVRRGLAIQKESDFHAQSAAAIRQKYVDAKNQLALDSNRRRRELATSRRSQVNEISERGRSLENQANLDHKAWLHSRDTKIQEQKSTIHTDWITRSSKISQRLQTGVRWIGEQAAGISNFTETFAPGWARSDHWNSGFPRGNDQGVIPLGRVHYYLKDPVQELAASELAGLDGQENCVSHDLEESLPLLFHWVEHGTCLLRCTSTTFGAAIATTKEFVLRSLSSLPAGRFEVTVIDPDGLGAEFSSLMALADLDPAIVNHRVWTQETHIREQLARLSHKTEDIIQQALRNQFRDIRAYNKQAGSLAEPFRLVVWSRFPFGLDEQSWKHLNALIQSGPRCGVAVLLVMDESLATPSNIDLGILDHAKFQLRFAPTDRGLTKAQFLNPPFEDSVITLSEPPPEELESRIIDVCGNEALKSSQVVVPFSEITPKQFQQDSTADQVAIPLGQSGVGRTQSLRLGHGTAQHVLIAGKTGSGKSSLLHTIVSSAVAKYAPSELRLVLLDFKKGVEFQVYSQSELPHADVIGIESEREFGLSSLEYLDQIMQRRGEMFRESGVQDIAGWRTANPGQSMPRILTVVDEFQELFVEDDKLGQQASMLLDRIVRQGRSFGMHVILASQTLGGAYSLPRTTLAQMAVRIALQCEGSDAMLILSEENLAAERLRHSGQAIYNEMGGRVEGNQPFQVAFVKKEQQLDLIQNLPSRKWDVGDESNRLLNKQVVFEGHRSAQWNGDDLDNVMQANAESKSPVAILGDSVSIEPAVTVSFPNLSGRNALMVGTNDRLIASTMGMMIASLHRESVLRSTDRETQKSVPQWTLLDGAVDDGDLSRIAPLMRQLASDSCIVNSRNLSVGLEPLHEEMQARLSEANESNEIQRPKFLVVNQLGKLRDLRKSDDFGFGMDSESEGTKPDQMLSAILRDGPGVGIFTLLTIDSYGSLSRMLARQSIHDLELRILGQMSSNDSNHLMDSAVANRLGANVLLVFDETSGKFQKFRPFDLQLASSKTSETHASEANAIAEWSIRGGKGG